MFGKLMDTHHQMGDLQLAQIQRQIKNKMDKAKNIAHSLETSPEIDDLSLGKTSSQVFFFFIKEITFPQFKLETNYSQQFWKTYLKNQLSFSMIKELSERTTELQSLIREIQNLQQDYFRLHKLKSRKKNRRLAIEIDKKFECPYDKCFKFYGSDVSLNLHIKLKHKGGNKTDRQKLAEQICIAEMNRTTIPKSDLNLPPGYLEDYRKHHFLIRAKTKNQSENFQQ